MVQPNRVIARIKRNRERISLLITFPEEKVYTEFCLSGVPRLIRVWSYTVCLKPLILADGNPRNPL